MTVCDEVMFYTFPAPAIDSNDGFILPVDLGSQGSFGDMVDEVVVCLSLKFGEGFLGEGDPNLICMGLHDEMAGTFGEGVFGFGFEHFAEACIVVRLAGFPITVVIDQVMIAGGDVDRHRGVFDDKLDRLKLLDRRAHCQLAHHDYEIDFGVFDGLIDGGENAVLGLEFRDVGVAEDHKGVRGFGGLALCLRRLGLGPKCGAGEQEGRKDQFEEHEVGS